MSGEGSGQRGVGINEGGGATREMVKVMKCG